MNRAGLAKWVIDRLSELVLIDKIKKEEVFEIVQSTANVEALQCKLVGNKIIILPGTSTWRSFSAKFPGYGTYTVITKGKRIKILGDESTLVELGNA